MNIGIIGIQGYGASYFGALQSRPEDRALAVCDIDSGAAAKIAALHKVPFACADYRELLARPEIEAVFIATPHFLHYPMAMDALRAGKHVFCEKPLAIRSDHAEEMAALAREKGLVLGCHYNQRQSDYVKALRRAAGDGLLGEVYQANVRWMARWTRFMFDARTSWRLQPEKSGGGIFIGRGSHMIDAIWWILGRPGVRSIRADTHSRLTGSEVDDFASAVLRLDGGAVVNVQCSYVAHLAPFRERIQFELYGTAGGASYDGRGDSAEPQFKIGRCNSGNGQWEDLSSSLDAEAIAQERPVNVIHDFLDAAARNIDPVVTGEDAAYIVRLLEAGYESARAGREIELAPPMSAPGSRRR